jgi:hypothetical protein
VNVDEGPRGERREAEEAGRDADRRIFDMREEYDRRWMSSQRGYQFFEHVERERAPVSHDIESVRRGHRHHCALVLWAIELRLHDDWL